MEETTSEGPSGGGAGVGRGGKHPQSHLPNVGQAAAAAPQGNHEEGVNLTSVVVKSPEGDRLEVTPVKRASNTHLSVRKLFNDVVQKVTPTKKGGAANKKKDDVLEGQGEQQTTLPATTKRAAPNTRRHAADRRKTERELAHQTILRLMTTSGEAAAEELASMERGYREREEDLSTKVEALEKDAAMP